MRAPAKGPHWSVTMDRSSVQDCNVSRTLAEARAPLGDVRVVAVVGSKPPKKDAPMEAWGQWLRLQRACIEFVDSLPTGTVVVSGGTRGIDQLAELRARNRGLEVHSHRPQKGIHGYSVWVEEWNSDGIKHRVWLAVDRDFPTFAAAAFWRNGEMVRVADRVTAFHDGVSRGTADTIRKARAAGKLIP